MIVVENSGVEMAMLCSKELVELAGKVTRKQLKAAFYRKVSRCLRKAFRDGKQSDYHICAVINTMVYTGYSLGLFRTVTSGFIHVVSAYKSLR